jgi:hypothetical protein
MMDVYKILKEKNIKVWNHESDLYVLASEETKKIKQEYEKESGIKIKSFRCQGEVDKGKLMYEFPFECTPFWNK